ncbi:MAG TPA: DNA-3-methyladenine glycosylase I [Thermoleophilaceae bacterium]|nr:DNA-3-methyladenine glycosylase I [Thermoleophilaceae bacterium]
MAGVSGVEPGPDGRDRCWWCLGAPEYLGYHDDEWGRPSRDDRHLFELLTLESFQSGLSWLTILRKREGFRRAFDDWDVDRIAAYDEPDLARLLDDAGIVRHRGKIDAAIANARAVRGLSTEGLGLAELLWRFAPEGGPTPVRREDLTATTAESDAMAKELKRRGFRFVGPTVAYSLMQAAGLVNDHLAGCAFREPR